MRFMKYPRIRIKRDCCCSRGSFYLSFQKIYRGAGGGGELNGFAELNSANVNRYSVKAYFSKNLFTSTKMFKIMQKFHILFGAMKHARLGS